MKEQVEIKAVVTFSVGHYRFCIPAHEVKAITTAPAMSRLPGDAGGVEGVFDYHGKVVTAVSLRRKLGLPDQSGESDVWIISCATSVPVAFHVDAVMKVVPVNTLEWRQIEGLQVDSIDRYALYENEIFFLTSCESLLAIPDVPEKIETKEMECPVETETAAPDSDELIETITHDSKEIETRDQNPTGSVREISDPAGADEKACSSVKTQRRKKSLQHSLTSVSQRSRFNTDRQQSRRESSKRKKHVSAVPPKDGYRRSTMDKQPASFIAQHNIPSEIDKVNRNFGWKLPLGIIASVALLCVFLLFHFGTTGKRFASMTSSTVKEEAGLTSRLSDQSTVTGMSLRKTWGDSGSEEPVHISGNQSKFDEKLKPAVKAVAVTESEQTTKRSEAQAGKISIKKAVVEHDDGGNIIPAQPAAPIEVLRVETKQYTVTVERSPVGKAVSESERPVPIVSYDQIIHVVVKGDTLWDIAERYLGNPFRYPELASLSNIRDPDWIYPGDVVRIVKKDQSQIAERS